MDDPGSSLIDVIDQLRAIADEMGAEEAHGELDEATLQEFWREWPRVSSWAGTLWRRLNADLADAAQPVGDPDQDEIGGSG